MSSPTLDSVANANKNSRTIGRQSQITVAWSGDTVLTEIDCMDCGKPQEHFWCKQCMDKWILERASA